MVVGQFTRETRLAVIGGGAGGCAAALRAAALGVETILVDAQGPAPHRTWLGARALCEAARLIRDGRRLGVGHGPEAFDLPGLCRWIERTDERLATEAEQRLSAAGVEVIRGAARFDGPRQLTAQGDGTARLRFRRAIIATGTAPAVPDAGGDSVGDAASVWRRPRVPETLLVLGGTAAAVELACALATLGSRVTLAAPDELLADADAALVEPLRRKLAETLAALETGTTATAVTGGDGGAEVELQGGGGTRQQRYECVVAAPAGAAAVDGLDLARAGVELDAEGRIVVDEALRTSNPHVLAVGDATAGPRQAAKAARQGRVAAEVAAGRDSVFDARAIPVVVHADPPLAWCGLTERAAAEAGAAVRVLTASAEDVAGFPDSDALARLIVDAESDVVLGVGLAGRGAEDAIGEAALAVEMGAVVDDLAGIVHAQPSLGALIETAALSAGADDR